MKRFRMFVAAAVAVGAMAVAPAASAACVGTTQTVLVCAEPTGRTLYEDCIYTGGSTCTPVSVPGPDVTKCTVLGTPSYFCQALL